MDEKYYYEMGRYLGEGWVDRKSFDRELVDALKGFEDWRQKLLRITRGTKGKTHESLLIKFKEMDRCMAEIERIAKKFAVDKDD